jgi:hypothetical protein
MKRYKMLNFKVIIEKDGKFKKFGGSLWTVFGLWTATQAEQWLGITACLHWTMATRLH